MKTLLLDNIFTTSDFAATFLRGSLPRGDNKSSFPFLLENECQMSGFNALWFKISVSTLAMKILAKATAIFVPMAVPWVCRQCFP